MGGRWEKYKYIVQGKPSQKGRESGGYLTQGEISKEERGKKLVNFCEKFKKYSSNYIMLICTKGIWPKVLRHLDSER